MSGRLKGFISVKNYLTIQIRNLCLGQLEKNQRAKYEFFRETSSVSDDEEPWRQLGVCSLQIQTHITRNHLLVWGLLAFLSLRRGVGTTLEAFSHIFVPPLLHLGLCN